MAKQETRCSTGGCPSCGSFRPGRLLIFILMAVALVLLMRSAGRRVETEDYELLVRGDRAVMRGESMGGIPYSVVFNRGGVDDSQLHGAADAVAGAIESVNAIMNPYDPASDLARLNAAPAGEPVTVDAELFALILRARALTEATDGAFDPTGRPLFELWKTHGRQGRTPDAEAIAAAVAAGGWRHFSFDADSLTIAKDDPAAQIDLGAIAKGYAVDAAGAAAMAPADGAGPILGGALVEVGGELGVFGLSPSSDGAWTIGVNDPFSPDLPDGGMRLCGKLDLSGRLAVATSGDYRRYSEIDGVRYSHILDPRTGRPVEHVHSVTIIAATCEQADALATALSVLGESGFGTIAALDGVEVMMILGEQPDARVLMTDGFRAMLRGGELNLWSPETAE